MNYLLSFVNRSFSHDVTAAISVYKTMNRRPCLCTKKNPVGVELFSHVKTFFYSKQFVQLLTTWLKTIYNKITAINHVFQSLYQTLQTIKMKFEKPFNSNKFSKTTVSIRFNLLQVCPSVPPALFKSHYAPHPPPPALCLLFCFLYFFSGWVTIVIAVFTQFGALFPLFEFLKFLQFRDTAQRLIISWNNAVTFSNLIKVKYQIQTGQP